MVCRLGHAASSRRYGTTSSHSPARTRLHGVRRAALTTSPSRATGCPTSPRVDIPPSYHGRLTGLAFVPEAASLPESALRSSAAAGQAASLRAASSTTSCPELPLLASAAPAGLCGRGPVSARPAVPLRPCIQIAPHPRPLDPPSPNRHRRRAKPPSRLAPPHAGSHASAAAPPSTADRRLRLRHGRAVSEPLASTASCALLRARRRAKPPHA